jgi:bilirubin oxidase
LVASRGETVRVNVHNDLRDPTTLHWHGMLLPAAEDGGPDSLIEPGDSTQPTWTVTQPAATLWYHPHPNGDTERQASMGLAGMFIVRDDVEAALDLPRTYGVDDVPVVVQDFRLDDENQFVRDVRGFIGPIGDQLAVNGAVGPYFDVTTSEVRLRLLNGSAARTYNFALSDSREFSLIATDGGLLTAAVASTAIQLSPGERAEIVVPMTAGETVVLRSLPADLGTLSSIAERNAAADTLDVLQLRAAAVLEPSTFTPGALVEIEPIPMSDASVRRRFVLNGMQINGATMEMGHTDLAVASGSTEVWSVVNSMGQPHNFHVHGVQFQVLSIDGSAPPPELAGWKDTVLVRPSVDYELIMTFTADPDPDHAYMYHCHLLSHEDAGMMGAFTVVSPGKETAGTGSMTMGG